MRIDGFRFRHVGPFGANGVSVTGLKPGLNVIAEHNERGKSSLLSALETVLFLPHTSWKGDAKRLHRDDGAPMGEVDFTHDGRAYRLIKRFVKSKHAALIDLSSGKEIAVKREAEERLGNMLGLTHHAQGPSGLLWVRQGQSMTPAQDDGQVASKLESELSTLVGGERARAYLDRAEAELGALLTKTGRSKSGGPLDVAERALEETADALAAARDAQTATHKLGLDLIALRGRIETIESDGEPEADAKALDAAREKLNAAKIAQSELDRQREQLARLKGDAELADMKLAGHLAAVKALDEAMAESAKITADIGTCLSRRTDIIAHLNSLSEQLDALEERRAALTKLQTDRATRERLSDRNAALQRLLANIETSDNESRQRAKLVATRDALPAIDRAALGRMDQLERTRAQTEAALANVSAALQLDLEPGVKARLGDAAVKSGPVQLGAVTPLTIEGVGTIRLAALEADDLRRTQEQTREALDALLSDYDVTSIEAAAEIMRERKSVMDEIALMDRRMAQTAPDGREALMDARTRLEGDIARMTATLDDTPPGETDMDVDDLDTQFASVRGEQAAAQTTRGEIDQTLATLRERQSNLTRLCDRAPETASPSQREAVYGTLAATAANLATQIDTAQAALNAAQAQAPANPDLIKAKIDRLSEMAQTRAETLNSLRMEEAKLSARRRENFEQRDPDAEVTRLEERAAKLQGDVDHHRRRAEALTLLRDTLAASQASLQDQYTDPVRRELRPLLQGVIDGAEIELGETLGAQGLRRGGQDDTLDRLSGGTQEQIAILTRLAFARLLAKGGQPCPVILDDALVYADDQRRARMFDVIRMVTSGEDALQLLYLSCHETSTMALGGNRLTLGTWPQD